MTSHRLPNRGRVDHGQPVRFTFDGKSYQGLAGDTLASALLANGVHLMGRSFKYHRPRGVVSAGSDEPNALVGTRRGPGRFEPNTRATIQELRDGLEADEPEPLARRSPSTSARSTTASARCSRPASTTRPSCGRAPSGTASTSRSSATPPASASRRPSPTPTATPAASPTPTCWSSAPAPPASPPRSPPAAPARRSCSSTRPPSPAAALLSEPAVVIDGKPAWDWLAAHARRARRAAERHGDDPHHGDRLLPPEPRRPRASASPTTSPPPPEGAPRERLWKVRANQVVLAQGALEKPLVFDGNDRPGVMLAGAAQTYLNRYGVKVGDRPAIVTAHDSAWHAAFDLAEAGAKPAAIVDVRPTVDAALTDRARALGIETLLGRTATGTTGRLRVKSLRVNRSANGTRRRSRATIACDAVLMCGGWTPCLHLFSHTKGSLAWDETLQAFLPGKQVRGRAHRRRRPRPLGHRRRARRRRRRRRPGRPRRRPRGGARRPTPSTADRTGTGVTLHGAADRPQRRRPPRPSSTSRTTSPPRTSASRSARACARSSTSSATPPPAWRPTRARCRTSTA